MALARAILCVVAASPIAAPVFAACVVPPFAFFPERNDSVVVTALINPGTPCRHKLAEGPGYRFTSITPILKPKHGSLSIGAHVAITYIPTNGFGGKDAYGIKACATKASGESGCSTLFFVLKAK